MTYYLFPEVILNSKKKITFLFLLLAGILIIFCSCASSAGARKNQLYVWLAGDSKFAILPPENIEKPMDGHQIVTASFGGQFYQLSAWVKADEMGIDMTLMNELGANMGELSFRDGSVSFSTPLLPKFIGGEYIVADFQFCFYNAPALAQALKDCGLSFIDTENSRRILQEKNLIIEIEKSRNLVKLVNHSRGYAYTLEGDFE